MKKFNLNEMTKGWFIGNFNPTLFKTDQFEVAIKNYKTGDYEEKHIHKIATEYTAIAQGRVKMNGVEYVAGEIIVVEPGCATDFEVLEDTITVVVKVPCVAGDKFCLPT